MVDMAKHPLAQNGEWFAEKTRMTIEQKNYSLLSKENERLRAELNEERQKRIRAESSADEMLNEHGRWSANNIISMSVPYTAHCGIYFLIENDTIVYIGQSIDIMWRVAEHRKQGKSFDRFAMIPIPAPWLDRIERLYVRALEPRDNKIKFSGRKASDGHR